MSNRDLPPNERLRALYNRFLTDPSPYYARSLAEVEHHVRKRALPHVGTREASADETDSVPPATEGV